MMLAVPFGGSRSVCSFLRVVRVVWWIACKCLAVMWANFYDDFVTFSWEREPMPRLNFFSICSGGSLLARAIKQSGLGAILEPWVSRLNCHVLRKVLLSFPTLRSVSVGVLAPQDALKLRGRLQFADGQLFGRIGRLCLKEVTSHAFSAEGARIGDRLRQLLQLFISKSLEGPPRKICGGSASCFYIFTDACFQPNSTAWRCGLGGVIYHSDGLAVQAFSFASLRPRSSPLGG